MFCKKCNRELDDNAKFCDWCGTKVSSRAQPKPKQFKIGLVAVTTLIINVLVIGLISGGISSLIKNNYVSKQDCLIRGTYHISDIDADGVITSYSYWNPDKSNSLLVFTSTEDAKACRSGFTLLKKEASNRFTWSVDGN